jgi:MFS family permease
LVILSNPVIGPVVGPIAGGFIAQTVGFKYIFIVIVGVSAIASIIGIPLLRETYAPVIRLRRTAKGSLDPEKAVELLPALAQAHGSKLQFIWLNLSRPVILLTRYGSQFFSPTDCHLPLQELYLLYPVALHGFVSVPIFYI